ncbi:hypothetical protein [Micromonospora sp. WMMB235]|uniref:hypothetical protein n=1 Tax=Micromonospora sp. WMMB235 TaxID=1172030 RepID=UPI00115FB44D|nr:hypothetical protein [Micromonospora sp. WMMB235]
MTQTSKPHQEGGGKQGSEPLRSGPEAEPGEGLAAGGVESEEVATLEDPFSHALSIVARTSSTFDFTEAYDQSVDAVEDRLVEIAVLALQELRVADALTQLRDAKKVRLAYLNLLGQVENLAEHPMAPRLRSLRKYAVAQKSMIEWLELIGQALTLLRDGRGEEAVYLLNQHQRNSETPAALISFTNAATQVQAEGMAAAIRLAVHDFSGARAGFDRASFAMQMLIEEYEEEFSADQHGINALRGFRFQWHSLKAQGLVAQYNQLVSTSDFKAAARVAEEAALQFEESASLAEYISSNLWAPVFRSNALEMRSRRDQALVEVALEREDWPECEDLIRSTQRFYESASAAVLRSDLPMAKSLQEKYLNAGFAVGVQLRRRLERERANCKRIQSLEAEVKELYASVRRALGSSGVVVNNATEMVSSVQQHVELTTHIEANLRAALRGVSDDLPHSDADPATIAALAAEAQELANSQESGPKFLERVKKYGEKVKDLAVLTGQTAGPLVELLKALSVIS